MTMSKEEVSKELQSRTKTDPVLNAAFHMLALRDRSRFNLTPEALYYKMKREGFTNYNKADYLVVFKTLAELGLARIVLDERGRVEQVRDFRLPLKQLGALACGQNVPVERMGQLLNSGAKPKVEPIVISSKPSPRREERQPRPYQTAGTRLILTVLVNDKPINIPVPRDLTPAELASFLGNLMDKEGGER